MTDSPYLDPYRDAIKEHGPGFEALLWKNKQAQITRFSVLDAMGDLRGKIVADLGCGDGGLAFWLNKHKRMPKKYIGVDGLDELVVESRSRAKEARLKGTLFVTHDFVGEAELPTQLVSDAGVEVFVLSGSLNTLHMDHAQRVLDRIFDALANAGRGRLVFNFLSTRHNAERTPAEAPAVRFEPDRMLDWALSRTPIVDIQHAYLSGHDATVCMDVLAD
jgi:SAM-dependent methyltransferase